MIIALAVIGGIVLANTALAAITTLFQMIQYLRTKNTIYKKGNFDEGNSVYGYANG